MDLIDFSRAERGKLYANMLDVWDIADEPTTPAMIAREAWASIIANWDYEHIYRVLTVRALIEEDMMYDLTNIVVDIRLLRSAGLKGDYPQTVCELIGMRPVSEFSYFWTNATNHDLAREYRPQGQFFEESALDD